MRSPALLVVSNQSWGHREPGLIDSLNRFCEQGHLSAFDYVPTGPRPDESDADRYRRVLSSVRAAHYDLVLALALSHQTADMPELLPLTGGRPILYWEGDAWGGPKRIAASMSAWLTASEVVFSVGGPPQSSLLKEHGARRVQPIVHTYDHLIFGREENGLSTATDCEATFIGSNLARIPGLTGLPGSWDRRRVVRRLHRQLGDRFCVAGNGWPKGWGPGAVPFAEQGHFIQRGRVLANWDHYPNIAGYTSDRLAITMISGRAQVTTRHRAMSWADLSEHGVFLRKDPQAVVDTVLELLVDPRGTVDLGARAWTWAKDRLSHRQAVAYMLSHAVDTIDPPDLAPWSAMPTWAY